MEDENADKNGRYRLQSSHDGRWRAAYHLDADGQEEEREHRWEQSELEGKEPLCRCLQQLERASRKPDISHYRQEAEHEDPESELQGRHVVLPLVDRNDIDRVRQRRGHDQYEACRAQFDGSVAPIKQRHACHSHKNGNRSSPCYALVEEHCHQHGGHDWVDKE